MPGADGGGPGSSARADAGGGQKRPPGTYAALILRKFLGTPDGAALSARQVEEATGLANPGGAMRRLAVQGLLARSGEPGRYVFSLQDRAAALDRVADLERAGIGPGPSPPPSPAQPPAGKSGRRFRLTRTRARILSFLLDVPGREHRSASEVASHLGIRDPARKQAAPSHLHQTLKSLAGEGLLATDEAPAPAGTPGLQSVTVYGVPPEAVGKATAYVAAARREGLLDPADPRTAARTAGLLAFGTLEEGVPAVPRSGARPSAAQSAPRAGPARRTSGTRRHL